MLIRRLPVVPGWNDVFLEMEGMRREMDRLFSNLAGAAGLRSAGVFPAINLFDRGDALVLRAEIPGIKSGDIEVTVENGTVSIVGERKIAQEGTKARYHRREREGGTFRRILELPVRIDSDRVQARTVNGVLTVELPKAAEVRPRQIAVQAV
jgi:HSP20 family protein